MEKGDYVGGGIVTETPLPPDKPFAVEAVVTIPAMAGDYIAEVFVSDSPDFDTNHPSSIPVFSSGGGAPAVNVKVKATGPGTSLLNSLDPSAAWMASQLIAAPATRDTS